jgi:hypothetical protein
MALRQTAVSVTKAGTIVREPAGDDTATEYVTSALERHRHGAAQVSRLIPGVLAEGPRSDSGQKTGTACSRQRSGLGTVNILQPKRALRLP